MKCVGPTFSDEELTILHETYEFTPELDELAAVIALYGQSTRLKIFALLDSHEMCVCDLASVLGLSVSAVSQNLAKLRANRLVSYRRSGQTLFYRLTEHPVNTVVRAMVADGVE